METVVIATIAAATVKLLSPFFEAFVKNAGSETGKAAAGGAMSKTSEIYSAIKAKFFGKPAAEEALADLMKHPGDPDNQGALRNQLKKVLESDENFSRDLAKLLKNADDAGASALFNTNIAGDVQKLVQIGVIHGDVEI
jgi:hypothetical protein